MGCAAVVIGLGLAALLGVFGSGGHWPFVTPTTTSTSSVTVYPVDAGSRAVPVGTRTTVPPTNSGHNVNVLAYRVGIGSGHSRSFDVTTAPWNLEWNFDCSPGRGTASLKLVRSGTRTTVAQVHPQTDVSWGTTIPVSRRGVFTAVVTATRTCSWVIDVTRAS